MKSILVILFGLIIMSAKGQILSGTYEKTLSLENESYTFTEDKTFTFRHNSCQAKYSGHGKYVFSGDSLVLTFLNDRLPKTSETNEKIVPQDESNFFFNGENIKLYIKLFNDSTITLWTERTGTIDSLNSYIKVNKKILSSD